MDGIANAKTGPCYTHCLSTLFKCAPGGGSSCADEFEVDQLVLVQFLMLFAVEVVITVLSGDCSRRLLGSLYLARAK